MKRKLFGALARRANTATVGGEASGGAGRANSRKEAMA